MCDKNSILVIKKKTMADKDLLGIIADMLRKLDQHSEKLNKQAEILELHSDVLRKQTDAFTLFMDGTLKQFEQQQIVNEKFLKRLESVENRLN